MDKICGIYKITSPTGRIYIGESSNINNRTIHYATHNCKGQPRLYNSLIKYGFTSHKFEIIEECKFEDLKCRERYWQDFYNVLSRNGLNCKLTKCGEKKAVFSEETRNKISKGNKGKIAPNKGLFGSLNPLYKIPRPQEVKDKIRNSKIGVPNVAYKNGISDESKQKMSDRAKGNKSTSRLVIDVSTGIFYNSAKEASKCLGINYSTVIDYLKGKYKNKSNLQWA